MIPLFMKQNLLTIIGSFKDKHTDFPNLMVFCLGPGAVGGP